MRMYIEEYIVEHVQVSLRVETTDRVRLACQFLVPLGNKAF